MMVDTLAGCGIVGAARMVGQEWSRRSSRWI
jgi:hypothetical protein